MRGWPLAIALMTAIGCGGTATNQVLCTPDCGDHLCGDDGCGTSCGTCRNWQMCSAGICTVNPASHWTLVALQGSVSRTDTSGGAWDSDGSPPDPFVCVTLQEVRVCTDTIPNSNAPIWRDALFEDVPASSLEGNAFGGGFEVELADADNGANEPVCFGHIAVTPSNFAAGQFTAACDSTNSDVTFGLVPVP